MTRIARLLVILLLCSACSPLHQDTLTNVQIEKRGSDRGMVVGSITALPDRHYHAPVAFHYRSIGKADAQQGVFTSGDRHGGGILSLFPSCNDDELAAECGRLFSVELPAGAYEIYRVFIGWPVTEHFGITSMNFSVTPGTVGYLGNIDVVYCVGLISSPGRGAILGADISIKDEVARDTDLLKRRFPALGPLPIEKRLLSGPQKWRKSVHGWFGTSQEPADWGTCISRDVNTG